MKIKYSLYYITSFKKDLEDLRESALSDAYIPDRIELLEFADQFGLKANNKEELINLIFQFDQSFMAYGDIEDFARDEFENYFPDIDENHPIMSHFDWRSFEDELKKKYTFTKSGIVFQNATGGILYPYTILKGC